MLGIHSRMVFREEMQKVVLTAMALQGCFNNLVFQGGTALRLFHGNPRFSEDIDLVFDLSALPRGLVSRQQCNVAKYLTYDIHALHNQSWRIEHEEIHSDINQRRAENT